MEPVGEGAIRVTTGRSDIAVRGPEEAAAPSAWAAPLSTGPRARPSLAALRDWLVARAAAVEPLDPLDARRPCSGRGAGVDGAGFREGGSGELCRQAAGQWRGVRARDLRGRRPWGVDPR